MAKSLATITIVMFILLLLFHLAGYGQLIQEGEISLIGAIYEAKLRLIALTLAALCIKAIFSASAIPLKLLTVLMVGWPLYHFATMAEYWLIHDESIYMGMERAVMLRHYLESYILVLGLPYLLMLYRRRSSAQ